MTKPHKHAEFIKAWADGAEIEQRDPNIMLLSMPPKPDSWRAFTGTWSDTMEYRVKPESPKYPETKMTLEELSIAADGTVGGHGSYASYIRVANAAIARAIEDGQVVPVDAVPGARLLFEADLSQLVPAAMLEKLARAVFAKCDSMMIDMYNDQSLQGIDLAAIIASVREVK